jgi:hypothetical protein
MSPSLGKPEGIMDNDQIYYARRAEEQRRAAEAAQSEDARRRHLDLAQLLAAHRSQLAH